MKVWRSASACFSLAAICAGSACLNFGSKITGPAWSVGGVASLADAAVSGDGMSRRVSVAGSSPVGGASVPAAMRLRRGFFFGTSSSAVSGADAASASLTSMTSIAGGDGCVRSWITGSTPCSSSATSSTSSSDSASSSSSSSSS